MSIRRRFGALGLGMGLGGGGRILSFIIDLITATCTRAVTTEVQGYDSTAVVADGQTTQTVPVDTPQCPGARLAQAVEDGAVLGVDLNTTLTNWTLVGTTVHNGGGSYTLNADGDRAQKNILTADDYFTFNFTISNFNNGGTDGFIRIFFGATSNPVHYQDITADGVYSVEKIADDVTIYAWAMSGGTCDIQVAEVYNTVPVWQSRDANRRLDGNDIYKSPFCPATAIGDSFTNGRDYIKFTEAASDTVTMTDNGIAGDKTTDMLARFNADVMAEYNKVVVIQGGINDLVSAGVDPNATMQSNMTSMANTATADGRSVIFINVSAWGNSGFWTAEKQGWTETYNTWLEGFTASNGFPLVDIYELLRDGVALDAAYDSGDGLHPNPTGYELIGDLLNTQGTQTFLDQLHVPAVLDPVYLRVSDNAGNPDVNNFPMPSLVTGPDGAFEIVVTPLATGQSSTYLMSSYLDSNRRMLVLATATTIRLYNVQGGSFDNFASFSYTHASGTQMRAQGYWKSTTGLFIRAADASADINAISFSTTAYLEEMPLDELLGVGHSNGGSQFLGDYLNNGQPIWWRNGEDAGFV